LLAYAKSLWLTFAWALRWGVCGAGRVARADAVQGVAGLQVAVEVAQPAGTRLAQAGQLNADRAGGWRSILKPDCE
jgi:hypothetical protein